VGATVLLLAALTVSIPATAEPPSYAVEEPGDKIAVTLTSGKTFQGTLVSRDERYLKIKMGRYEIDLPSRLIDTVKVTEVARKPEPAAATTTATPIDTSEPEPSVITLTDGRKLKGWIVKKDSENTWVVFGSVHPLLASQVESVEGGPILSEDGAGGATQEAESLVGRLGSADKVVRVSAASTLRAMGKDAIDLLLPGLDSEDASIRLQSVDLLMAIDTDRSHGKFMELLASDPDPLVRGRAAAGLGHVNTPAAKRALFESAKSDSSDKVRVLSVRALRRRVTTEDVSELMRMMSYLPEDSIVIPALCAALRHSTLKLLSPEKAAWTKWWEEEGGREEIQKLVDSQNLGG
jgi:hypothetical protein